MRPLKIVKGTSTERDKTFEKLIAAAKTKELSDEESKKLLDEIRNGNTEAMEKLVNSYEIVVLGVARQIQTEMAIEKMIEIGKESKDAGKTGTWFYKQGKIFSFCSMGGKAGFVKRRNDLRMNIFLTARLANVLVEVVINQQDALSDARACQELFLIHLNNNHKYRYKNIQWTIHLNQHIV